MPSPSDPLATTDADLNAKILSSIARWIQERHGVDSLERLASTMGLRVRELDGRSHWISLAQFEGFLEGTRALAGSDEAFTEACVHRFADNVGALRYMTWALTPEAFFDASLKMAHVVVRVGKFERVTSSPGRYVIRYVSPRYESRLACLCRMAQQSVAPTLWGLPRARIRETSCIAHGDACCEYELRWNVARRPVWIGIGAVLGALLGFAIGDASFGPVANRIERVALASIAGASVAMLLEQRRSLRANSRFAEETAELLRETAAEEAEARAEIMALHVRQRDWSRLLEEQLAERTGLFEKAVATLGDVQTQRVTALRSFSHDLRNPLFVLKGNIELLRDGKAHESERPDILADLEDATRRMEQILTDLMDVAIADTIKARESLATVPIAPLTESYRRRLRALVHGRDIKVSVFATREAPEHITIDPLILDRIVDNLVTNAAKYTERGSIVLEIGGMPGHLTLKLSDTGRGIKDESIAAVFRPRDGRVRTPLSQGVGLAGIVQLLGSLGGRLDVMSRLGLGTTFWAHIPESASLSTGSAGGAHLAGEEPAGAATDRLIRQVVTIRKDPAA